jgi:hypothetical protein
MTHHGGKAGLSRDRGTGSNLPTIHTATCTHDAPPPPTSCPFMDGWLRHHAID